MAETVMSVAAVLLSLAVFAALFQVISRLMRRQLMRRVQGFTELARRQELRYAEADPSLVGRWSGPPFDTGDHQQASNVLSGSWHGREVLAFDFTTVTRSAMPQDPDDHRRDAVVAMRMPCPLPALQVNREGIGPDSSTFTLHDLAADAGLTGALNALGRHDIQFPHEQFNRRFRIQAPDPAFARAVLHPGMIELLLARCTIAWRFEHDMLIGWHRSESTTDQVVLRLDLLRQILDAVPPNVWRDYVTAEESPKRRPTD